MHTILKKVLTVNDIARVNALISSAAFIDGRETSALAGKKNLQLPLDSEAARKAGAIVVERLHAHDTFKLAVQPLVIHPPLFSRYEQGMEYPDHIDVAIMGGIRTDVALTLFLSERDTYDGGDLVVDTGNGIRCYRLDAGDAIAYPASTVHHVAQVARGARLAAVLWVQSLIRDPRQREILYDLGISMQSLQGSSCGPRLSRSYWNLVRLWAETSPRQS
jgi:PKHD-type hydroxylase